MIALIVTPEYVQEGCVRIRVGCSLHTYNLKIDKKGNVYSDAYITFDMGGAQSPIEQSTFIIEDNIPLPLEIVYIYKTIYNGSMMNQDFNIIEILQTLKHIKQRPLLVEKMNIRSFAAESRLLTENIKIKEYNSNIILENKQLRNDIEEYQLLYITTQSNETSCKEEIANLKLKITNLDLEIEDLTADFDDECKEKIKRERETYKFKEEITNLNLEIERLNDNALINESLTDSLVHCNILYNDMDQLKTTNIELESIIFEKELEIVILKTKLTHISSLSDTILKKNI